MGWAIQDGPDPYTGAVSRFRSSCMHRLCADDLGHRFGRRALFRHLSMEVEGGEAVAVTGRNGSGKSTLLRILAGVLAPVEGTVRLVRNGQAIPAEERPLHTGYVAPYLNVYEDFSARENLAFLARVRRLEQVDPRIDQALEVVGLAGRADDRVGTFSSGMRQRVKYAAALVTEPVLLLLDEPSTNLDAAGLAMVDRVMQHQRTAGGLLVVATNNAEEAARCDRQVSVEPASPIS